jgi:hypothetical protein
MSTICARVSGLAIACAIIFYSATVRAQSVEQPKPGPEHKKLEIYVGEWNYKGEAEATPFGPAGKFAGKETSRMVLGGFFLESRWEDKGDSGYIAQGIVLTGYNAATKSYPDYGFENDGSISPGSRTVSGNTWTSTGSRTDRNGKVYRMKFVSTLSADATTFSNTAQYSADDGKTWLPFFRLTMNKVSKRS